MVIYPLSGFSHAPLPLPTLKPHPRQSTPRGGLLTPLLGGQFLESQTWIFYL